MTDFETTFEEELAAVPEAEYDRETFVPSVGPLTADVMLVGEAPGENEVAQKEPFVGQAGRKLDSELESIGVDRGDLYITNVVKVRPPDNRTPRVAEIEAWMPLLEAEIERVDPEVIVPLGTTATQAVLGTDEGIGSVHGREFDRDGRTVVPIYHPAALFYDRSKESEFEADLRAALADA